MSRKVVLYISSSLDGFLAGENDELDFLSLVEQEGEDYGYTEFIKSVDTYIVGRRTYEVIKALAGHFPHADAMDCYVITSRDMNPDSGVTFFNGDLETLISTLKSIPGKNIYCDGGATLAKALLEKGLIDEIILSIIPIILGKGIRLFQESNTSQHLELVEAKSFESGLVQMNYRIKNEL